jgi:anti-sigma regulatory factor (Ser/Thr protein kinase)
VRPQRAGEWCFEVFSTLEAVEEVCADFKLWRAVACARSDPFSTELLLREALTNSVLHGCSEDPGKSIRCVFRAKPGRLLIAVRDEGEGFDWRSAWNRLSDISDTHGRGVEIFRRYASAVRFNTKGNSITLVKRF